VTTGNFSLTSYVLVKRETDAIQTVGNTVLTGKQNDITQITKININNYMELSTTGEATRC
jgi:DUF917 family protein